MAERERAEARVSLAEHEQRMEAVVAATTRAEAAVALIAASKARLLLTVPSPRLGTLGRIRWALRNHEDEYEALTASVFDAGGRLGDVRDAVAALRCCRCGCNKRPGPR